MPYHITTIGTTLIFLGSVSCATWDNPTALADLNLDVQVEIEPSVVETYEEVDVHIRISESGAPLKMHRSQLQIRHVDDESARVVEMEPEGDGYSAQIYFYEEGDHEVRFLGMPEGHTIMGEFDERVIQVQNQHRLVGGYWVEMEVSQGPIYEDSTAQLRATVYDLQPDGARGVPVPGLTVSMAVLTPAGAEVPLSVSEEQPGEYEAGHAFGSAGLYELQVEVDVGGVVEEGQFHVPVQALQPEEEEGENGETGGGGHGP